MAKNPFLFNTHDLPRRPGEMREYELTIDSHEELGFEVLSIAADEPIDIDLRIESVAEGILATATVRTEASGECGRCLDAVFYGVDESFQELYEYVEDPRQARKKNKPGKKRPQKSDEEDLDEDLVRQMDGEMIDLDGPIRDAIILNLPINPLCSPDCPGLCPDCGIKWIELPEDHAHAPVDIRWAGLENWGGTQPPTGA
ncbi:COG1399 Predicted metal-binding, possibly nucleic acid-binding protein [actinobacterium SCGC AAA044-D11]|jgi:uncharacterized protein|uniref:Unannotated protein n=1 Tax=freshwater metagenome TaxID=449393 RepID=A0A6J6C380_9ZZZZ|nr:DUF177 domain-containing protein [Actinomycetota bacterium]MTA25155.1 DUF177 domain-containing protein [Actinomycetota bacterium]